MLVVREARSTSSDRKHRTPRTERTEQGPKNDRIGMESLRCDRTDPTDGELFERICLPRGFHLLSSPDPAALDGFDLINKLHRGHGTAGKRGSNASIA